MENLGIFMICLGILLWIEETYQSVREVNSYSILATVSENQKKEIEIACNQTTTPSRNITVLHLHLLADSLTYTCVLYSFK